MASRIVCRLVRSAVSGPFFLAAFLVATIDAQHPARTQPYCAQLDDGSKTCGIPSLEGCRQTVSGAGGVCIPDETSQMRRDVFDGSRLFPGLRNPPPGNSPQDPNWMPPPPGQ